MANIDTLCIENLEMNSKEVYLKASEILLKLLKNIVDNPDNQTYKSIRVTNPNISSNLLNALGAEECLIKIGFVKINDRLTLSPSISVNSIYEYYEYLLIRRTIILSQTDANNESIVDSTCDKPKIQTNIESEQIKSEYDQNQPSTSRGSRSELMKSAPKTILNAPNQFLRSLETHSLAVLAYENPALLRKALSCIPVVQLEINALEKMRSIQKSIKSGSYIGNEPLIEDLILLELLDWFKNHFFTWVDKPSCENCGNESTTFAGNCIVATERVEVYRCNSCAYKTNFTRHCDPEILLSTRRGRCGEWANCFTLLCRAMGWPARHVIDESDHVWTEVYSEGEGRWLHCDPCENVCDNPLIYEQGWGKQPKYIIAYACDDVQDVTWRYTTDFKGALKRRNLCSEEELLMTIEKLRNQRQKNLSVNRKKYLAKRTVEELVEFMTPRNPKESEKQGRTSGSLGWRLARGETKEESNQYVWYIDELSFPSLEIDKKCFKMQYSICQDLYECVDNKNNIIKTIKGWNKGIYFTKDVFRKEERDWKMVYLARKENASEGELVWRFAIKDQNHVIEDINAKIKTDVFENGNISCMICSENICLRVKQSNTIQNYTDFKGQKYIEIKLKLSGGKGSVSWQHAQVFRQKMSSIALPMQINITIKSI